MMSKYTLDVALIDESDIISNLYNRIYQLSRLLKPVMREIDSDKPHPEVVSVNLVDEILNQTNRLDYLVYFTSDMLDRLMIERNGDNLGKVDDEMSPTKSTKSSNSLDTLESALAHHKHTTDSLLVVVLKLEDKLKMILLPQEDIVDISEPLDPVFSTYVTIVEHNRRKLLSIDLVLASIIERLLLDTPKKEIKESVLS